MANLQSFENRLQNVKELISKLNNGKLTAEELEQLVESTRDLYERSVILQYKSFEEKVFGVKEEIVEIAASAIEKMEADEIEIEAEEQEEESVQEPTTAKEPNPEHQAFDFSLFDEPIALEPIDEKEIIPAPAPVNEPVVEEHFSTSQEENEEDDTIAEQIVVEQTVVTFGGGEAAALAGYLARLIDQSEKGFNMPPLDTLVGTFGLNERLQYINELFNGSSEEFAEAVKKLDSASGFDEALNNAATYGLRNQWDRESETVLDFVTKLKRRYV